LEELDEVYDAVIDISFGGVGYLNAEFLNS
jgi:hypothetical protein